MRICSLRGAILHCMCDYVWMSLSEIYLVVEHAFYEDVNDLSIKVTVCKMARAGVVDRKRVYGRGTLKYLYKLKGVSHD